MSIKEIRKRGIEALLKALGPVNMLKFLEEFNEGEGNYTEDRRKFLDKEEIEDIVKEIEDRRTWCKAEWFWVRVVNGVVKGHKFKF